jgi:hypothetical protein
MGDGVGADTYDDVKVEAHPLAASHQLKHGILEDGYNKVCNVFVVVFGFCSSLSLKKLPSFSTSSFLKW